MCETGLFRLVGSIQRNFQFKAIQMEFELNFVGSCGPLYHPLVSKVGGVTPLKTNKKVIQMQSFCIRFV